MGVVSLTLVVDAAVQQRVAIVHFLRVVVALLTSVQDDPIDAGYATAGVFACARFAVEVNEETTPLLDI